MLSKCSRIPGVLFVCLLTTLGFLRLGAQVPLPDYTYRPGNVTIYRDGYGIPHIHGKTDADVAYGLAYACAEDDFGTVQQTLLAGRMSLGLALGIKGAAVDYAGHLLRVRERALSLFRTELTPEFQRIIAAQVQGYNDYARRHPDKCLVKGFFPITVEDIATSFLLNSSLVAGLIFELPKVLKGQVDPVPSRPVKQAAAPNPRPRHNPTTPLDRAADWMAGGRMGADAHLGSNALALKARRTYEGNTFLLVNSHQPLEGPLSWYECHLISDEGWNTYGGTFPGGPTVFHGVNPYLGWAHTSTTPDVLDVFEMRLNPKDKYQYWFDGKWERFEVRKAPLKVKLGGLKLAVKREVLWCKYGPAVRSKNGKTYAVRLGSMYTLKAVEQWYRMNRATNLEEFRRALEPNCLPRFNITYADNKDNIYYTVNALFPNRPEGYDWKRPVRGDTSATLWNSYLPFQRQPSILNPTSGYVLNTNQPFYLSTAAADAPAQNSVPAHTGFEVGHNNRSSRMMQLVESRPQHTYDQLKNIKWDLQVSDSNVFVRNLEVFKQLDATTHPEVKPVLEAFQAWDKRFNRENPHAGMIIFTLWELFKATGAGVSNFREGLDISPETALACSQRAVKAARKVFKDRPFTLGDALILKHGDKVLPCEGFPDVLAAMTGFPIKKGPHKGKFGAYVGDSFMLFVRWERDGSQQVEALHVYGQSKDPQSPHFADQMEDFMARKLRPVYLDLTSVRKYAKRSYQPGE